MGVSRFTIRTSDCRTFRRCLRKWGFLSSMKENLQGVGTEQNVKLWFGSGIHFALEDYHGYNRFGDPRRAFKAYYDAFGEDLPGGAPEHYDLGIGMLTYYMEWYEKHNRDLQLQTVWLNDDMEPVEPNSPGGHPAVEQQFFLDLGLRVIIDKKTEQIICEYTTESEKKLVRSKLFFQAEEKEEVILYYPTPVTCIEVEIVPIYYHGTLDKIVVDKYGRWWILDYKTAKGADTNKLDTDDQVSRYLWAAEQWFKRKFYGFIYLQLTKDVPRKPRRLQNGQLSVDKKQKTTYALVRQELINEFGSVRNAPNKYIEFLNNLAEQEFPEGDRFIRWDFVQRTPQCIIATYNHIMGEARVMINPNLYLYPNPTRDCIWDCPFRQVCLAMDNGNSDDVRYYLNVNFEKRPRGEEGKEPEWHKYLVYPGETPVETTDDNEFKLILEKDLNIVLPDDYLEEDYE